MELEIEGVRYAVPAAVESAGREALRAWILDTLPPAHAALALGEPAPVAPTPDLEA